jgi:hypothetical protein
MEWTALLRRAVLAEGSQGKVAGRLGYSPTTLSMVLSGTYQADTAAIEEKVMEIYGGQNMQEVPSGYMRNAVGHLVPIESVKEIDLERDRFVKEVVGKAREVNKLLAEFKKRVAGDMQAFLELSAEKYKVNLAGAKGNLSLTSFDGRYRVMRCVSELLNFDERLQAAKAMIDECLREWTKDSGVEIKTLVEQAFQVDKQGRINTKRILSLRSLKIEHPTWKRAMEAIGDAVTVVGSCTYYRVYERDDEGNYHQLCLDFSGV